MTAAHVVVGRVDEGVLGSVERLAEGTGSLITARGLFPILSDIIAWHVRGTRFGIGMDSADGLLRAGEEGVQLTWMDARVDGWVVTPRTGKPVEINALWYNALRVLAHLHMLLQDAPGRGADWRLRRQPLAASSAKAVTKGPSGST